MIGNDCIGSCKSNYHTITHDHDGHSCQYVNAPISKFWWTHLSNVAAKIYFPFGENFTNDTGGLSSSESEKKIITFSTETGTTCNSTILHIFIDTMEPVNTTHHGTREMYKIVQDIGILRFDFS